MVDLNTLSPLGYFQIVMDKIGLNDADGCKSSSATRDGGKTKRNHTAITERHLREMNTVRRFSRFTLLEFATHERRCLSHRR